MLSTARPKKAFRSPGPTHAGREERDTWEAKIFRLGKKAQMQGGEERGGRRIRSYVAPTTKPTPQMDLFHQPAGAIRPIST